MQAKEVSDHVVHLFEVYSNLFFSFNTEIPADSPHRGVCLTVSLPEPTRPSGTEHRSAPIKRWKQTQFLDRDPTWLSSIFHNPRENFKKINKNNDDDDDDDDDVDDVVVALKVASNPLFPGRIRS